MPGDVKREEVRTEIAEIAGPYTPSAATNVKEDKMKRMLALVSALVVLGLPAFAGSAEASGPNETPNGRCGALNMLMDPTMLTVPMVHNTTHGSHGNDGMFHAVDVSGCP